MSWRRVGSTSIAGASGVAALTVARPAGVVEGDLLVFGVVCQALSAFPAQVGGTGIHAIALGSGIVGGTFIGVVGSADPAGYEWLGEDIRSITCAAYRGTGGALTAETVGGASLASIDARLGDLLVAVAFAGNGASSPAAGYVATAPGGMSEAADVVQSSGLTTYGNAIFDEVAAGGASGTRTPAWGGVPAQVGGVLYRFLAPAFWPEVQGRFAMPSVDGRFIPAQPIAGRFLTPGHTRGRFVT